MKSRRSSHLAPWRATMRIFSEYTLALLAMRKRLPFPHVFVLTFEREAYRLGRTSLCLANTPMDQIYTCYIFSLYAHT